MITCSPAPAPIIKAALLAEINNDLPCFHSEEHSLGLFGATAIEDADSASLPKLIKQLSEKCGLDASWLTSGPGQTLARLIAANLRFTANDKSALIFAAVEQALRYGHSYCFCGIGDISRIFVSRAKMVSHEVDKMLGFIRFHPAPDNTLAAKPKLFHNTADLILKNFAPRYPNTRLVFVIDNTCIIYENGQISSEQAELYRPYVENNDFAAAWETYYQSQYIAARKNIKLAQHVIPKKYWSWLEEGKFLKSEALK